MTVRSTVRRTVCAVIIALPLLCAAAEEQAAAPKDPVSPSADFHGREEGGRSWVRAALTKARGERLEGELLLSFATLDLDTPAGNGPARKSVPLAEISFIEFVRWQGQKRGKNEYLFNPVRIRVTMTDRTVIESRINTRALYRLRLKTGDRTRTLFPCFFEYREKDAWKNSGEKDVKYPETNPNGETVVKIELIHVSETSPLDAIIKLLEKK